MIQVKDELFNTMIVEIVLIIVGNYYHSFVADEILIGIPYVSNMGQMLLCLPWV